MIEETICFHDFHDHKTTLAAIPGIREGYYERRAILLPAKRVYVRRNHTEDEIRSWHGDYLASLGLGCLEVVFLDVAPGEPLFSGVSTERGLDEYIRLRRELTGRDPVFVEGFNQSSPWNDFANRLDIQPHQLATPMNPNRAAPKLNHKLELRLLGQELGVDKAFAPYAFAKARDEVVGLIKEFLARYGKIAVKRPDLDSGVGQAFFDRASGNDEINAYLDEFCDGNRVIVERFIQGFDASVHWEIDHAGRVQMLYTTRQYIERGSHEGNVLGVGDAECLRKHLSQHHADDVAHRIIELTRPFAEFAAREGYFGRLGIDLMVEIGSQIRPWILEANPRTTASRYLRSVMGQARANHYKAGKSTSICGASRNCHAVPGVNSWRQAVDLLGPLAMRRPDETGVIVAMPDCLHLARPKCLLISLAETVHDAEANLCTAMERLQTPQTEPVHAHA